MSVYEHLWKMVQQSSYSSANGKVAEYLLVNYENISTLSIQEIAQGSYVTKGTVSKFFKTMTETGTFESFQQACNREKASHKLFMQKKEETLIRRCRRYHEKCLHVTDLRFLKYKIQCAKRIILFSKLEYEYLAKEFCWHLLKYNVMAKTVIYAYDRTVIDELKTLTIDDAILFIDAGSSFFESMLQLSFEFDFIHFIESLNTQAILISKDGIDHPNFIHIPLLQIETNQTELDAYKCVYTNLLETLKS